MRRDLERRVGVLEDHVEDLMSAKDDLAAAVAALQAEDTAFEQAVSSALTDLQAEVAKLSAAGVDTASVEAAIANIQAVVTAQTSAAAAAKAADPGPQ